MPTISAAAQARVNRPIDTVADVLMCPDKRIRCPADSDEGPQWPVLEVI